MAAAAAIALSLLFGRLLVTATAGVAVLLSLRGRAGLHLNAAPRVVAALAAACVFDAFETALDSLILLLPGRGRRRCGRGGRRGARRARLARARPGSWRVWVRRARPTARSSVP